MNKVLLAVILAGFGAQIIKLTFLFITHKSLTFHDLIVTGGMPSSHSAFVMALTTAIYLHEGATTAFAISLVLALLVIRDAFGVRRTVGEEGLLIQRILKKLKLKTHTHIAMGHTPAQVFVGAFLGVIIPLLVFYLL